MLRSSRPFFHCRIATVALLAGFGSLIVSGCETFDVQTSIERLVPVYGLPEQGVADPDVIVDQYIVVLPPGTSPDDRQHVEDRVIEAVPTHGDEGKAKITLSYDYADFQGFAAHIPPSVLDHVQFFSGIEKIVAARRGERTGLQTCPGWNLDILDTQTNASEMLDNFYAYAKTGQGMNVLVVDTGLNSGDVHSTPLFSQWFPNNCGTTDANGHGTMVAEVIAGKTFGVAKEATIAGYDTSCAAPCDPPTTIKDLDALLDVAARVSAKDLNGNFVIHRPLIVVYPHAFPKTDGNADVLRGRIATIIGDVGNDVIFITGAGNGPGNACEKFPAYLSDEPGFSEKVISVGGYAENGLVGLFHSGACVDLFAPATSVRTRAPAMSTCGLAGEMLDSGTSYAAAHVAGVAALLLQEAPKYNIENLKASLIGEATRGFVRVDGLIDSPNSLLHLPKSYNWGESGPGDSDTCEDNVNCFGPNCEMCAPFDGQNACNIEDPNANACQTDPACELRVRCTGDECAPCGRVGNRCCTMGAECDGNLECNKSGFCACGGPNDPCCTGSPAEQCGTGLVCGAGNQCTPCGGPNGPCCTGSPAEQCGAGLVCGASNTCNSCGGPNGPCCTGSPAEQCGAGLVCGASNMCNSCGGMYEACCPDGSEGACETGLACSNNSCVPACVTSCCDGAKMVLGDVPDDQCIRDGGGGCWGHDGPLVISNHGANIWKAGQCRSLHDAEAVCCDGARIPLQPQFDENVATQIAKEECNIGPNSEMRETYMGGQLIAFESSSTCGKCDVSCCDGTRIGGDFSLPNVSTQNACKRFGGSACREHGYGPQWIKYDNQYIWSKGVNACPTLYPCVATCNDGTSVFVDDYLDQDECNLFGDIFGCAANGGLKEARLLNGAPNRPCKSDGTCATPDVACEDGICKALCRVRCKYGEYLETYTEAPTEAGCLGWTESQCLDKHFGDHMYVWFNGKLLFNREEHFPGICGGSGVACCHTSNVEAECNDPSLHCLQLPPPPGTNDWLVCASAPCGHEGDKCCESAGLTRWCAPMLHCKPNPNPNPNPNDPANTCQPCGELGEECCTAATSDPQACAAGLSCVLTGMPGPGTGNEPRCQYVP